MQQAPLTRTGLWPEQVQAEIGSKVVQHGALLDAWRMELELESPSPGGMPATTRTRRRPA